MKEMENWVRKLYSLGYTPIPIAKNSKAPNGFSDGELKSYHYNRPTMETIEVWLREGRYENVALLLGKAHGNLVCFDFDNPKAFQALDMSTDELIKEGTWVVATPKEKGRYHIYAEHIGDVEMTRQTVHGVEYRANEHYVLCHPSIHPNGKQYNLLNTNNPDTLARTHKIDVNTLWDKWTAVFHQQFDKDEDSTSTVKDKKEFDRSPECIRGAWENGAQLGERQYAIIGLANWMRENKFPETMAQDIIMHWFRSKCNTKDKSMSEVMSAIEAGYNDRYTYGCRFWRNNTSYCPFSHKEDCKFFQPDVRSKRETLERYEAVSYDEHGNKKSIFPPKLARLLIEEYDYHFTTIIDESTGKEDIFFYENGYYNSRGRDKIRQLVNYYLEERSSEYYKKEVIGFIGDLNHIDRADLEPPTNLINVKNGILNIDTMELSPHTPDYYFINQIPINYNPDAACPLFDKFLEDVVYEDHIPLMQEILGFILYRKYFLNVAFLFVGGGRNGKGVLINVIRSLVGRNNYSTKSLHDLTENRFSTSNLYGKLVNVGAEVSDKEIGDTATFKNLTGNEPISAEIKHGASFSFKNYAKLIFNANRIPYSRDHSFAFKQRWVVVPFPKTFARGDEKTDPLLEDKLTCESELEGVLNWAIAGLKRLLQKYDFTYEAADQYEEMINPEKTYINNHLEIMYDSKLPKDRVYEEYVLWCHKNKYQVVTEKIFRDKVKYYFPEVSIKQTMDNKKRFVGYIGLAFREQEKNVEEGQEIL